MTDERELLELAARAAGIEHTGVSEGGAGLLDETGAWDRFWNPLESLSDALRLAVDLNLMIQQYPTDYCVAVGRYCSDRVWELWIDHPDKYQATCMAILKAAAEIGRGMK